MPTSHFGRGDVKMFFDSWALLRLLVTDLLWFYCLFFFFFLKICLFEREREQEGGRETQADSVLSTEPNAGLSFITLRSQPEPKPRVRCLTDCATQESQPTCFLNVIDEKWRSFPIRGISSITKEQAQKKKSVERKILGGRAPQANLALHEGSLRSGTTAPLGQPPSLLSCFMQKELAHVS